MRRSLIIAAAIGLTACRSSEPDRLARQYDIMVRDGATHAELCDAADKVAQAYLAEEDSLDYQLWRNKAALECNEVLLER